jgi:hypothetical protein
MESCSGVGEINAAFNLKEVLTCPQRHNAEWSIEMNRHFGENVPFIFKVGE